MRRQYPSSLSIWGSVLTELDRPDAGTAARVKHPGRGLVEGRDVQRVVPRQEEERVLEVYRRVSIPCP